MTPFLRQVARHYCNAEDDPGRLLFVLPSQRAAVFFDRYFACEVKESGRGATIAPKILSIDKFFSALSPLDKADRITLLVELYNCYKALRPGCESLDEFVFWGDMILSDYEDVDKYLVEPRELFRNVSELRQMQDDLSYLSENQREAISKFLNLFRTGGEYKDRFSSLWSLLAPMYEAFNASLLAQGKAYEGSLLRDLVRRCEQDGGEKLLKNAFPDCSKVIFCGLNALNSCEKKIFSSLHTLGLAEFCWDYVDEWIRDEANQSSRFLKDNVLRFPQAFPLEGCGKHPDFEVVSIPSGIGQTRLLSNIFEDGSIPMDERTAIVLPDEAMLLPLLGALPEKVRNVNVTMGFPMVSSSFFSLMDYALQMQLNLRRSEGGAAFYHRQVWSIASNNIFAALADETTRERVEAVRKAKRYFIAAQDLCGTPLLDVIFRPADNLAAYVLGVLDFIGSAIATDDSLKAKLSLEMDFAMEFSKVVHLLDEKHLEVKPATWVSLLRSLLQTHSVPFKGEPLAGLQIMGPLEIRALDFEKLIIFSCNEGVFPRRNVASSFIPPLLRRGFDMPTYEYQDAVWAYYFYRMIQRPSKVWMIADTRSEGLKSGEESRYIKQLQYHFEAPLVRRSVVSVARSTPQPDSIPKTSDHIVSIRSKALSASALKAYLNCPAKFYYGYVEGLSTSDEVAESLDFGMTGNVFHKVMERLYKGHDSITSEYLDTLIDDKARIRALVEQGVKEELGAEEIHGRDIVITTLICKYVAASLGRDLEFLRASGRGSFEILGLEKEFRATFNGFRLKGIIDRLDSFGPGMLRVVDYKTGNVLKADTDISDETAEKTVEAIFNPKTSKRPEIALQFFIYDYLLCASGEDRGKVVQNCVYSTRRLLGEAPVNVLRNEKFYGLMSERLYGLLLEMVNPDIPFSRTGNAGTCEFCDFKTICGR